MIEINPCHVESKNIHGYGYDEQSKTLAIQFKNSAGPAAVWHYANVTPEMFAALKAAESVGKWFHTTLRGQEMYPGTKR